jgi:hypothetical protein
MVLLELALQLYQLLHLLCKELVVVDDLLEFGLGCCFRHYEFLDPVDQSAVLLLDDGRQLGKEGIHRLLSILLL